MRALSLLSSSISLQITKGGGVQEATLWKHR
uniref:Uncharacterized protein n=1 Tax=Arundo donax TaxID=35708 RepID=A0A0A9T9A9_ARUDO